MCAGRELEASELVIASIGFFDTCEIYELDKPLGGRAGADDIGEPEINFQPLHFFLDLEERCAI